MGVVSERIVAIWKSIARAGGGSRVVLTSTASLTCCFDTLDPPLSLIRLSDIFSASSPTISSGIRASAATIAPACSLPFL